MKRFIDMQSTVKTDDYTAIAEKIFDYKFNGQQNLTIENNLILPEDDWQIGIIHGPSGSGKSTIIKELGECKQNVWDDNAIISNFANECTPEEAAALLCAVGLSSVPTWVRPYNVLSTGEKFRADMARYLTTNDDIIIVDEYTSVVNREVAMSLSNALQKYIRKTKKKIILVSCHDDIIAWLRPDWTYNTIEKLTRYPRGSLCRPKIQLEIIRCKPSAWQLFKNHHYLSGVLPLGNYYGFMLLWGNVPIGYMSLTTLVHNTIKRGLRTARTVILPDFQGLGLGIVLKNLICQQMKYSGFEIYSRTANIAMIKSQEKDKNWKLLGVYKTTKGSNTGIGGDGRECASFKYIGEAINHHLLDETIQDKLF